MEPRYSIMNAEHIEILNIAGPVCVCADPRGWDREFKVIKLQMLKVCKLLNHQLDIFISVLAINDFCHGLITFANSSGSNHLTF